MFQDLSAASPDPKVQIRCAEGVGKGYVRLDNDAGVQEQIDLLFTGYLADYPREAASSVLDIGEEYYWAAQRAAKKKNTKSAAAAYEKGIGVLTGALPHLPSADIRSMALYMIGLDWYLKDWYSAAIAFTDSVQADPKHRFADAMHWLVADCYEKLKKEGSVSAEDADGMIEYGYQTLFDNYPGSPIIERAALRLGEISLARGKPASACVYFNWFLDHAHADDGRIPDVYYLMTKMEGGCQ